jgi:hypothetical protein
MSMIMPSLTTLTLPRSLRRFVALEFVHGLFNRWREEAERVTVAPPRWPAVPTTEHASRIQNRVRALVEEAEADESPDRFGRLCETVDEVLREARGESLNAAEGTASPAAETALAAAVNPFLDCRVPREHESSIARGLEEANRLRVEQEAAAETARAQYEASRILTAEIENNRLASQADGAPADNFTARSPVYRLLVVFALVWFVTAYLLNWFVGSSWLGFIAGFIIASVVSILLLLMRGNNLKALRAFGPTRIFPESFKSSLRSYIAARLSQYEAEREVRIWERRRQSWSGRVVEHELTDAEDKLKAVGLWLERQLNEMPQGFFDEPLPGDLRLYGRGLGRLLARDAEERDGGERLAAMFDSALKRSHAAPWRTRLSRATAAELCEELVRAGEEIVGGLNFSAVLATVLKDPQGATAANGWLRRLRQQVLEVAEPPDGGAGGSNVRETLSCGLPEGESDPLARDIAKILTCRVHESTIPDGLELVCVTRNVGLDDLNSTQRIRDSYEKLAPNVRDILFNFPSRARVASGAATVSRDGGVKLPGLAEDGGVDNRLTKADDERPS